MHGIVEHKILQGIGVPDMGSVTVDVEDLRVKLGGCMDTSVRRQ